jgi:single-strand selective monofunctional uracil DNA glycosylase
LNSNYYYYYYFLLLLLLLFMGTLISISSALSRELSLVSFAQPVEYVYDPTDYARQPLHRYLEKYGQAPKHAVFVGMNPGPWGMVQTGIPFGEVNLVKEWLDIEGSVGEPARIHPNRPVDGFSCGRSEVSGTRLWGWARERFGSAKEFFRYFLVLNYCPLAFFDQSGKNITPDKLSRHDRDALFPLCDHALGQSIRILDPEFVIGVGRFSYGRAAQALEGMGVTVGKVTHPSPANPAANRGWAALVERELAEIGIELPSNVSA